MTTEISNLIFSVNNQIATLRKLALQHGEEMPELREQTEHQIYTLSALKAVAYLSLTDENVSVL
jgi:hypothetical protein